ncbi:hypothetical protein [Haloarchaeobius sp. HRN-SO-5]|uniref:hypothetical protein n=1 Tax=Haloarchaeobius sp. HRN-SO-5 TaxID=3446118 RepID=UPI003EB8B469
MYISDIFVDQKIIDKDDEYESIYQKLEEIEGEISNIPDRVDADTGMEKIENEIGNLTPPENLEREKTEKFQVKKDQALSEANAAKELLTQRLW